jgi:hypothetical protein
VRVPALALILVGLAACRTKPSAALELEGPPGGEASPAAGEGEAQADDARARAMCGHSYAVLSGENPSLRGADIERDFVERCVAGNATKQAELGEARWAERASCIERASTSAELGLCDGRAPRVEVVVDAGPRTRDPRVLCRHIIDMLIAENPDFAAVFNAQGLDTFVEECASSGEEERREDPVRFDAMYDCMIVAQTMEEFERCDDQAP